MFQLSGIHSKSTHRPLSNSFLWLKFNPHRRIQDRGLRLRLFWGSPPFHQSARIAPNPKIQNPKPYPETRNPEPETLNSQPETINSKPGALHKSKPYALVPWHAA